jgi:hypothetical protein
MSTPIREACCDIDGEWCLMVLENWIGAFKIVPISIVKSDTYEFALEGLELISAIHLIQANALEAPSRQITQYIVEVLRRNFEKSVRLEGIHPCGPHMMERKNATNSLT